MALTLKQYTFHDGKTKEDKTVWLVGVENEQWVFKTTKERDLAWRALLTLEEKYGKLKYNERVYQM